MVTKAEKLAKEEEKATLSGMLSLDEIIADARLSFTGKEKGLALQITSGNNISRPNKDSDFICYPDSHWEQLTGIRGIPFGRVVQIAGKPDSGKSTHGMAFIKNAQDHNVFVILWDAENKFSATRFDKFFGGNSKNLLVVQSKLIATGGDQVRALANAIMKRHPGSKILIVWDSVGGTLPKNEDEDNKSFRDSKQMAAAAKENGEVLRGFVKLMEEAKDKSTNEEKMAVLLINQCYASIGSHGYHQSGGAKVEYFSSLILQLSRKADLISMKKNIRYKTGIVTRAKVVKNHLLDSDISVSELDLVVTASGIKLLSDTKIKAGADLDDSDDENGDIEELE